MRIIILIPFFFTLLLSQPLQKVTLQLQWKHQFEFAGFYAAKELGYFAELGLDVEFKEFQSGMDITQEVLQGHADYATSYSSIVLDYLHGKPIVLLANFFKQSPVVLVTQKEINTPKDLIGKKVMGLLDSTHNQTLLMMLDRFGVSSNDFINVKRSFAIDSFLQKEVDAISVFTTNEVFILNNLGVKFNILDPAAFGIKFYDINLFTSKKELQQNPQRVEAFRQAVIRGWEYALQHKDEIAELILQKYNTQNKTKEALIFEANQIEYLMLTNVYPIGSISMHIIQSIADSYLQIDTTQKQLVDAHLSDFVYTPKKNFLSFNQEQNKYLKEKKLIKMCVDPNWMPLEMIDNGEHVGIASDVIKLIAQKIQTPIQLVPTTTWAQTLRKAQNRECDILSLAVKTPKREKYLNFTMPYVQTPLVVLTKIGIPFMSDLNEIKDEKLGVVAGFSTLELLKERYEGIHLVEVDSIQEGLEQVREGKLFGFLDNALVINHELQKNGYKDISINGQFQESFHLSIAVRNDELQLYQIMQKALFSLDKAKIKEIVNKWGNIKYQVKPDYELIAKILFLAVISIGIFIYWNMRLKEEIKKKDEAKIKLKESEARFRTLFDVAPVMINSFDEQGNLVFWNQECEKVFGWSKEELMKTKDPLSLFYPDPKDKEAVIANLRNAFEFKEWHPVTKDGQIVTNMWTNIHMPSGEIIHVGYDISAQRSYEVELSKRAKELEKAKWKLEELNNTLERRVKEEIEKNLKQQLLLLQQHRLAQMGEMIGNIAHQWRQPLSQINSCVLIIDAYCEKENALKETSVRDKFNEIEALTDYMSKTIDDFQNFFNPDKKKKVFNLYETLQNAYRIVEGALKANSIDVEILIDKNIKIDSYMQELEHVFIIILNNAKDALTANEIKKPKIRVSAEEEKNFIILKFCDNALGIKPEIIEKIFEPYFTTKHKSQGTGLGLYMAKMIVEEGLQGSLQAYNKDNGACFELQLPKGKKDE